MKIWITLTLTICLHLSVLVDSQSQYDIYFANPFLGLNECKTEIQSIESQAFVPYVDEMIELQALTPDIAVKNRPDLLYSTSFMNEYSTSISYEYQTVNNYSVRRRKMTHVNFHCSYLQCTTYNIVQLSMCDNCRRRLDEKNSETIEMKEPNESISMDRLEETSNLKSIQSNRKLAVIVGSRSSIPLDRGSMAIKLVYDLINLLPTGTCKTKLSAMNYTRVDVTYY